MRPAAALRSGPTAPSSAGTGVSPRFSSHASSSLADTLSATTPGPPEVFYGFDDDGARIPVPMDYPSFEYEEFSYLTGSIR